MKIKNVMFSGFAAAVFASVCGAAVAADVSLISKDYADAKLQSKLTQGQGIDIVTAEDGTTTISANVDLSSLATQEAVESALADKADKSSLEDLQTNVTNNYLSKSDAADTYLTETQVTQQITNVVGTTEEGLLKDVADNTAAIAKNAGDIATNAAAIQLKADATALDDYAKSADVYTKTAADEKFLILGDEGVLGANLKWDEDGKLNTEGIATTDGLKELEDKVEAAVTETELEAKGYQTAEEVQTAIAGKADSETVATDIAAAVKALEDGQVKTNKEAIEVLNGDATTAGSVAKAIADAQSDLQDDIDAKVSQADYDAHLLAQAAIDEEQTGDIAENTANIATNAAAIAKKVSIVDTAGSYLVNFDASGNVSYAPISILDGQGNPIALTGDNTVKPQ